MEILLSLERTPFEGQVVHDRSLTIERFPQTASHAKHLTTAPLIHDSKLRLTLQPSPLRVCVCVLVLRFQGAVFQLRDINS